MELYDVIIIGASAAGLMCAIESGKRRRKVLVLDHSNIAGKKVLISGGGRCNFTNALVNEEQYISHNPHFCKSSLRRYTSTDFLSLVNEYKIPWHEKHRGQYFCDHSSKDIMNMILKECSKVQVKIKLNVNVDNISKNNEHIFILNSHDNQLKCKSLVIATGGLSLPNLGATSFGFKVAEQFGIKVWPLKPALVPFTLNAKERELFSSLAGVSLISIVSCRQHSFKEDLLFTHRGLSGPAILQISSYWNEGEWIAINLLPDLDLHIELLKAKREGQKMALHNFLKKYLPGRIAKCFIHAEELQKPLFSFSDKRLHEISEIFHHWKVKPGGTEGYRTAEVTLGGVDCDSLSSKTMECKKIKGLYFVGEVIDVTGWLGGYNLQWAWASGWSAGQYA